MILNKLHKRAACFFVYPDGGGRTLGESALSDAYRSLILRRCASRNVIIDSARTLGTAASWSVYAMLQSCETTRSCTAVVSVTARWMHGIRVHGAAKKRAYIAATPVPGASAEVGLALSCAAVRQTKS